MINRYERAYTEVLEILSHLPKKQYDKIPKEKIDFYKNNRDKDYIYHLNSQIELSKQTISKEANAILISLFIDYIATERQKEILKKFLNQNQVQLEKSKKEIYSVDNIFKKGN